MLDKDTLNGLIEFLNQGQALDKSEIPDVLLGTDLLTEKTILPPCSECGADPRPGATERGETIHYSCRNNHPNEIRRDEALEYQIQHTQVFEGLASLVDLTISEQPDTTPLPRYAIVETKEGIHIALVYRPRRYNAAIRKVARQALEHNRPTVFFTPHEKAREVMDLFEEFPLGPLVCPLPLQALLDDDGLNTDFAKNLVQAPLRFKETREYAQQKKQIEFADVSDNPLHVAAQLNYLRVLRENKEFTSADTDRFEHVCSAALAMMFTVLRGEGGAESSGEKLPDILFEIEGHSPKQYPPIVGVADAKSGAKAEFSKEKIERKHKPYVERAYHPESSLGGHRVAHTFIVFDIKGHQELSFFRAIDREVYSQHKTQTTMTVWYADALAYAYGMYLMADVVNEIKLSVGDFTEALRPFFDSYRFNESGMEEIQQKYRKQDEDYIDRYKKCDGLIVVTIDMVYEHFRDIIDDDKKAAKEHVLKAYLLD